MLSYSSAYYEQIKIPIAAIGIIAFIASTLTAYAGKQTHFIEKNLGERASLRIIPITLLITTFLLGIAIPYLGIIFYLLLALISGFSQVVLDNYMNKHIETSHRVTMLSIKNLFVSLAIFLVFPLFGKLMTIRTSLAYCALGLISLIYFNALLPLIRKEKLLEGKDNS